MAVGDGGRHGGQVRRSVWLVVLVVVLVVGCSGGGDPVAAPTTTAPEVVTTTVPAVVTTSPTTTEVVPFETEVKRAAIELLAVRNDVFQHPDVARVAEYIAPTCVCLERERGFIERFVNEGLRWSGPAVDPIGIRVSNSDPSGPSVIVVAEQLATEVVDASGIAVDALDPVRRAVYALNLVQVEGNYRINGLDTFPDLASEAVEAIVAEGLP